MELLFLTLWTVVAIILGEQEAILFHLRPDLGFKYKHIHVLFTVIRGVIVTTLIYGLKCSYLMLIPATLTFPFYHDGAYYVVRNKLNPTIYKLRWKAQSHGTTAIFSFTYSTRLYLLLIGYMATIWILLGLYL